MRGAFRKNPQRMKARENEPTGLPELPAAPESFTADQKKAWTDIVDNCPAGVLKASDTIAVEIAARLLAQLRAGTLDAKLYGQLNGLLSKFGMNPADRSKVAVPPRASKNPFADIG
jgi:hypothetical protein